MEPSAAREREGFGSKRITFWGSVCLNLNNCMGAAMVTMPLLFQQAGWFSNVVMLVVIYLLSTVAGTMLCEAMQRIPGNYNFGMRYEFATVVRHYWGQRAYVIFQVLYNLSMQASNIASMIISAQILDDFVYKIAGHNYALQYQEWPFSILQQSSNPKIPWCSGHMEEGNCTGESLTFVISLGYLICMAICIPFGYLNLDENMWFQWFSFWGLWGFTLAFWVQFGINMGHDDLVCYYPSDVYQGVAVLNQTCASDSSKVVASYGPNGLHRTPFFVGSGQGAVVGIAVFAYAYIVTIPSWINEKQPHVNVNAAMWVPATLGLVMKVLTGLLGAWAFALILPDGTPRSQSDDILSVLLQDETPVVSQYVAYLWDITTLIPGIPVLAIMVRYNLLNGKVCGRMGAFFWGVVAPWLVTMFLYETDVLVQFCTWVGIVVQGYINFVVPVLLYKNALQRYPNESDLVLGEEAKHLPSLNDDDELLDGHSVKGAEELHDGQGAVNAVPSHVVLCGRTFRINRIGFANFLVVFFALLSTISIVLNVVQIFDPNV